MYLQLQSTSVSGSLRESERSEMSQREGNEAGETDDVSAETYQAHLPSVKITQARWEMEG